MVVAVALWNKGVVAEASFPSRRGPMGRSRQASDDLCSWIPRSKVLCCSWRVVWLGGDGEAAAVSCLQLLVLRLRLRFGGRGSFITEKLVGLCTGVSAARGRA